MFIGCFVGFAAPWLNAGAQSTRSIRGVVSDSGGQPIQYVNVYDGRDMRLITDDQGRFEAVRDRKQVKLEFRRIGLVPVSVLLAAGADTNLSITMIPTGQAMPEAVITANAMLSKLEARGFYRRMLDKQKGVNSGHFITQEEIERRQFSPMTALLRGLPSVQIRYGAGGIAVPTSTLNGGCVMATYLDGYRIIAYDEQRLDRPTTKLPPFNPSTGQPGVRPSSREAQNSGSRYTGIDNLIQTSTVAGIEVYPRPGQVPGEYQMLNGTCGVILIWSK
jgi:hypothetical protein